MIKESINNIIEKSMFVCILMFCITFFIQQEWGNIFIRIAFLLGLIKIFKNNKSFDWNYFKNYLISILIFILGIFLTVVIHKINYNSISMFETIMKMMIPFFVIIVDRPNIKKIYMIFFSLIIGFLINDIYAIYHYYFTNFNERAIGISGGVLYLAGLLIIQFPILLCLLVKKRLKYKWLNYMYALILILILITVYINASRMTWCILIIDMFLIGYILMKTWKKRIILSLLIMLSMLFLYNFNDSIYYKVNDAFNINSISTKGHYYYARDGLNLFWDNKVWGVGLNNFKEKMVENNFISNEAEENLKNDLHNEINGKYVMPHAHNDIVMFLSEMGIIGGSIYLIFYCSLLIRLFKDWINYKDNISLAVFIITVNFLIRGITDYNLANIETLYMYFFALALYIIYIYYKCDNKNIINISEKYLLSIYGFYILVILLRTVSKHFF